MKRLVGVAVTALLSVSVCFTAFGAVSTNASPWAVPHMEQAYSLQLISAPLLQQAQDTMTRVEFSEIAVAFYEKVTGTSSTESIWIGHHCWCGTGNIRAGKSSDKRTDGNHAGAYTGKSGR